MNENELFLIKNRIEKEFRKNISDNLNDLKSYPEVLQGTMLEMHANTFIHHMKESYNFSLSAAQKANQSLGITKNEWDDMIDEITGRILKEYIIPSVEKKKSWFSRLLKKKD
jgi:hypothetical protein